LLLVVVDLLSAVRMRLAPDPLRILISTGPAGGPWRSDHDGGQDSDLGLAPIMTHNRNL
jgi:hypothetical protein